jgi:signal transduction histidine kinase
MFLITVMLLIVVGIPMSFFVYQLDRNYDEFTNNLIETTSQVVYQFIYEGMMKNDSLTIQSNIELLAMDPNIELVRLYRPNGTIIHSSQAQEISINVRELPQDIPYFDPKGGEVEAFYRLDNLYAHHHLIRVEEECTSCHQNKGDLIAVLDVQAGFTTSEYIYQSSKQLAIFGGLVIIVVLWILLNLLYQSQVESRVQIIMSGFQKLSGGNFNFKINMPGKHELALLAGKFNEMIDNLKNSRQKEDTFLQEKLQRADRLVTLGEVAAVIAHEVNNPAGIILTRAEFLKELIAEQDPKNSCLSDLDIIIKQTEKIADTTHSILHYSRKLPYSFSATNLTEVVQHSIKILKPRIKKNKIDLQLKVPEKPTIIWGNSNQLEQVLCNLINNSLDFVKPADGKINITIEKIQKNRKLNSYRLTHQDNGPGIPPEFQDKIFSPFFTTKDKDHGTGLGLFIVKNIISNHKGSITLERKNLSGAHFIIELGAFHEKS